MFGSLDRDRRATLFGDYYRSMTPLRISCMSMSCVRRSAHRALEFPALRAQSRAGDAAFASERNSERHRPIHVRKKKIAIAAAAIALAIAGAFSISGVYLAVGQLRALASRPAQAGAASRSVAVDRSTGSEPRAVGLRAMPAARSEHDDAAARARVRQRSPSKAAVESALPAAPQAAADVHYAGEFDPAVDELLNDPDPRVRAAAADFFAN